MNKWFSIINTYVTHREGQLHVSYAFKEKEMRDRKYDKLKNIHANVIVAYFKIYNNKYDYILNKIDNNIKACKKALQMIK